MTEKKHAGVEKKICYALAVIFVALGVAFGIRNFMIGEYGRGVLGFASFLFLLLFRIFEKLMGGVPWFLLCEGFAFCILSYDIGSVYNFFETSEYLDKVAHLLSGVLFTTLGYCVYLLIQKGKQDTRPVWIMVSYAVFFSCTVAVVWEIYEFSGYVLFGLDSQHTETTGVFDTMYDLISCFVGSLVCAVSMLAWRKKGVGTLTGRVLGEFDMILSRKKA